MTRDEAVVLIQDQLGFRSDQSAKIITYLKFAQEILERSPTKPWFLISEQHSKRTTADEYRLILPDGFLQEIDKARLVYVIEEDGAATDDFVDLLKDDYDQLNRIYKEVTGAPEAYALMGNYFHIFPKPDDTYLIKLIFYKEDDLLDSNIENAWLREAPLTLIGKAGGYMASAMRNASAMQIFRDWESEGRLILHNHNVSRDEENRTPQIGGSH